MRRLRNQPQANHSLMRVVLCMESCRTSGIPRKGLSTQNQYLRVGHRRRRSAPSEVHALEMFRRTLPQGSDRFHCPSECDPRAGRRTCLCGMAPWRQTRLSEPIRRRAPFVDRGGQQADHPGLEGNECQCPLEFIDSSGTTQLTVPQTDWFYVERSGTTGVEGW
jgi:hypothetical protein